VTPRPTTNRVTSVRLPLSLRTAPADEGMSHATVRQPVAEGRTHGL
jgi:hypothetical protein